MPSVEEVIVSYLEKRDRRDAIARRHKEELEPLNKAMEVIETWLLSQLNTVGSDSFKTGAGTAYKTVATSVKLADAGAFKGHVFAPAIEQVNHYLRATGYDIQPVDLEAISRLLIQTARWGMVDFRAGKKGILDELEATEQLPPGVTIDKTTQVNVRRS